MATKCVKGMFPTDSINVTLSDNSVLLSSCEGYQNNRFEKKYRHTHIIMSIEQARELAKFLTEVTEEK